MGQGETGVAKCEVGRDRAKAKKIKIVRMSVLVWVLLL